MSDETQEAPRKPLTPAAQRALAEAEARRREIDAKGIITFKITGPMTPEIVDAELLPAIARARG